MHWYEVLSYAFVIVVIVLVARGAFKAFQMYVRGDHHIDGGE